MSFQEEERWAEPTACTSANRGRCECGDESQGFQTYTFWLGDIQRCFTVFTPPNRKSERLAVVLAPNCYAKDQLRGIEGKNDEGVGVSVDAGFFFRRRFCRRWRWRRGDDTITTPFMFDM